MSSLKEPFNGPKIALQALTFDLARADIRFCALQIDSIRAQYPLCDIILPGINPSPERNFKDSSGRFWTGDEVFNGFIRPLGETYRTLAANKGCDFLQISHVFNPEVAYPTKSREVAFRSASTVTYASDSVHSSATGYAMIADAIFYYILWKYCQP